MEHYKPEIKGGHHIISNFETPAFTLALSFLLAAGMLEGSSNQRDLE